nr:amino acid adenylation domain-containing protein [uncultured Rhodoferax sp.]
MNDSLHTRIAHQARQRPRATAVVDRVRRLTYAGLERDANQLAHHLCTKPLAAGQVVALALEPSCECLVALLAIWKAGAVALPLDVHQPRARLQTLLADAGAQHLVSVSSHDQDLRGLVPCLVHLDAEQPWIARQPRHAPGRPIHPLACLLYTSGSTGQPKGVPLTQAALLRKFSMPGAWGVLDASCRAAWHSSPGFDASLAQALLPLLHGGSVRAIDSDERLNPRRLWSALKQQRCTVLDATPSWLLAMLDSAPADLSLRRVVLGGEILAPALAQRVMARWPQATLINVYGPTEACIDATAHQVTAADLAASSLPIGQALPGYEVMVLDDALQPLPQGAVGELCIASELLAPGYWQRPEASAARFVRLADGRRVYRSGDLARQQPDGTWVFLGRNDLQVKLRGQRVELGEIDACLSRLPGVAAAAVKVWPGAGTDARLVGYLVLGTPQSLPALRALLREQLPAVMVPAELVLLRDMPMTLGGKVDRAALPEPVAEHRPQPDADAELASTGRNHVEAALLDLWRRVLERPQLGLHDNFFEHGGDSLAAVELLLAMERQFSVELPLAMLLDRPTVADLALGLARYNGAAEVGSGRQLWLRSRPVGGTGPAPLILLPPGSGAGLVYAGLVRELPAGLPCLALQAVGLGGSAGSLDMPALAARFVADVQAVQPHGDIQLCGYSAGGAIALEMCHQLQGAGRRVARLLLLDPYCPDPADAGTEAPQQDAPEAAAMALRSALRDMLWDGFGLRDRAAEPALALAHELLEQADLAGSRLQSLARQALPAHVDVALFSLLVQGAANLCAAYRTQRPQPLQGFDGEAWFVQPLGDAPSLREARVQRWQRLLGVPLRTLRIPGEHAAMLQRDHSLSALGQALRPLFDAERLLAQA